MPVDPLPAALADVPVPVLLPPDDGPAYELGPDLGGTGLFSRRPVRVGDVVGPIALVSPSAEPSRWSLMREVGHHGEPWPPELRYLQHACAPSCAVDLEAGVVRALRDLGPGDALTIFYPSTEWAMAAPFACGCGSPGCLGVIDGASTLPDEILARYTLSPAVRRLLGERGRSDGA